jgi:hypothetical protein
MTTQLIPSDGLAEGEAATSLSSRFKSIGPRLRAWAGTCAAHFGHHVKLVRQRLFTICAFELSAAQIPERAFLPLPDRTPLSGRPQGPSATNFGSYSGYKRRAESVGAMPAHDPLLPWSLEL